MLYVTARTKIAAALMCKGAELVECRRQTGNNSLIVFELAIPTKLEPELEDLKALLAKGGFGLLLDLGMYTETYSKLKDKIRAIQRSQT